MAEWYQNEIVRKIFDTTPDMLGVLDENGKILECNHHVEGNTGYAKKELIGLIGPIDLIDERDRERAMREFGQVKTEGINLNVQLLMRRKDGSVFPSLWSGSILRDQNNNIAGYLVTGKDLSEIYELKYRLTKSQELLNQEKLAVIGELTARVAHDLRNPLNIIKNTISLMKLKNPAMVEDMQRYFDRLGRSVDRMTHQVEEVLDYVRPTVLNPKVSSLCDILRTAIERTKIPDTVHITLPTKDVELLCDMEKMEIVFANLITNATQAMKNYGVISITVDEERDWITIEVSDTGGGIPKEMKARIFEPLFTTKQTGTGLGLVSCKNIIENHGGSITLKETGKNGTTFSIRLHRSKLVQYQPKDEVSLEKWQVLP